MGESEVSESSLATEEVVGEIEKLKMFAKCFRKAHGLPDNR